MKFTSALFGAAMFALAPPAVAAAGPTDPQIAHIAYTAGNIDIAAAKQALARSHNKAVRELCRRDVRDHQAVNDKALALVKKLHVTPEANPTSAGADQAGRRRPWRLATSTASLRPRLRRQRGRLSQDGQRRAGIDADPSANNAELKSLLETGLTLVPRAPDPRRALAKALK